MKRFGAMLLVSTALAFGFSAGAMAAFTSSMTAAQVQAEIELQLLQDNPSPPPAKKPLVDILREALAAGVPDATLAGGVALVYPNLDSDERRAAQQALIDAGSTITIIATGTTFTVATTGLGPGLVAVPASAGGGFSRPASPA